MGESRSRRTNKAECGITGGDAEEMEETGGERGGATRRGDYRVDDVDARGHDKHFTL